MAIAKVILNGVVQIDVTQDTVASSNLLSGYQATKNDGTTVSGGVSSKSAATYHPSTTDQSIPGSQYLSGAQTIKAVTLTNLSAGNIKKDVVVKVGDSTDDDCVTSVTGTYEGSGGGNSYTRTEILPSQSFTPGSDRRATLSGMTGFVDGGYYIVTYDGVEWLTTCDLLWSVDYCIGEVQWLFGTPDSACPFCVVWESGAVATVAIGNTSQHTIKIERLEFVDGPLNLITKSITANGTYNASSDNADGYSSVTVNVSGGGSTPVPAKDVNFIDYDGTILYSYTKAEALALGALPSNPSHTGLTAQGWNYTLAQIKTECNSVGKCTVGQMYITQSGDTEIDVSFVDSARLSPILTIAVNGTVTVDWGDNTTADTVTGTSLTARKAPSHTYASTGDYTIKIHVVSGNFTFYGSTSYLLLRKNTSTNESRVYSNCVSAVRLGSGITSIGQYAFFYCYSLSSITIPSSVTSIGTSAFSNCYPLASITIPSSVTSIGTNVFNYCSSLASITIPSIITSIENSEFSGCSSLASITIPSSVTSIGDSVFNNCSSLSSITISSSVTSIGNSAFSGGYSFASITIPSSVTSIGNSTFAYCGGVAEYHFLPTTPPTLGTTAFNSIASDCIIYVPRSTNQTVLNAYKTETNWSAYASYIQEEPA